MSNLIRYKDYAPTQFDTKGLALRGYDEDHPDRQDWYVAPVIRTRDSKALEESNFHAALEILGGESDFVEVHRFGHWGPGWYEIILVHPDKEGDVEEMTRRLENYPVLDDEDHSKREYEWSMDYLEQQARGMISDVITDSFPDAWVSVLFSKIWDLHSGGGHNDGDGDYWSDEDVLEAVTLLGWANKEDFNQACQDLHSALCSLSVVDRMQLETALEQFPQLLSALDTFQENYNAS